MLPKLDHISINKAPPKKRHRQRNRRDLTHQVTPSSVTACASGDVPPHPLSVPNADTTPPIFSRKVPFPACCCCCPPASLDASELFDDPSEGNLPTALPLGLGSAAVERGEVWEEAFPSRGGDVLAEYCGSVGGGGGGGPSVR